MLLLYAHSNAYQNMNILQKNGKYAQCEQLGLGARIHMRVKVNCLLLIIHFFINHHFNLFFIKICLFLVFFLIKKFCL